MIRRLLSSAMLFLFLAVPATAAEKTRWLHVRVHDGGPDGETVHVNVPLSLIDGVLPLLEEKGREHGARFRIDDADVDRVALQRILGQLRSAPEATEVLLEKDRERLWFRRAGERLQIRVEQAGRPEAALPAEEPGSGPAGREPGREREPSSETRLLIPMKLAEALVASPEMDLKAVLQAFEDDGEILVVDGEDDTTVRVWIDHRSGS